MEKKKPFLPVGPMLSLALVGLMVLGGVLYTRAIRVQRFLEPALLVTQPSLRFDQDIGNLLVAEFGPTSKYVRYGNGVIQVHESIFFDFTRNTDAAHALGKLANAFTRMLENPELRSRISVVLVSKEAVIQQDPRLNIQNRKDMQDRAEHILSVLFAVSPDIYGKYSNYFEPTALPVNPQSYDGEWVKFRLIPSEMLHIEVLLHLEKYIH